MNSGAPGCISSNTKGTRACPEPRSPQRALGSSRSPGGAATPFHPLSSSLRVGLGKLAITQPISRGSPRSGSGVPHSTLPLNSPSHLHLSELPHPPSSPQLSKVPVT